MEPNDAMKEIQVQLEGMSLNYTSARSISETVATQEIEGPMCIAWYDGQKQEEHPNVTECQHKPGWLAYAEGHGGRLTVDLNRGEFIFIFTDTPD